MISFFDNTGKNKIDMIKLRRYTKLKKQKIIMITYLTKLAQDIVVSAKDNVEYSIAKDWFNNKKYVFYKTTSTNVKG